MSIAVNRKFKILSTDVASSAQSLVLWILSAHSDRHCWHKKPGWHSFHRKDGHTRRLSTLSDPHGLSPASVIQLIHKYFNIKQTHSCAGWEKSCIIKKVWGKCLTPTLLRLIHKLKTDKLPTRGLFYDDDPLIFINVGKQKSYTWQRIHSEQAPI